MSVWFGQALLLVSVLSRGGPFTPLAGQPVGFAPDWQRPGPSATARTAAVLGPVLQRPRVGESHGVTGLFALLGPVDLFGQRNGLS